MTEAAAPAQLTGPQRAAIFLLGVGEEGAAAIMRHMVPKEVQQVGEAMASLSDVSNQQIASVLQEFSDKVSATSPISIGASDFTRRVMVEALGENRARSVLGKVMQGGASRGIDALKWMDPRSVARMIKNEHPQIVALVLAYLQEDQAAKVLELLPVEGRSDLVMRIARLDMVDPAALEELDRVLEIQLATNDDSPPASVNGLSLAAGILNNLETDLESEVLEKVKSTDFDLGEKIENLMFVFDNLMQLDDRGMQRLIREISGDSLLVALKGVDEEMKARFFKNMSSRAAEMLQDDMEAKGPVKLSDVEAEQKQILTIAKKLADDGEIFIGKGGGDFV
ncbi:flagellar motor switch protein FliG [Pseudohalioglobus lutimaris]|uniref:Flagellar motor switch protein FliG n=1 Tax=Pseudohalioglobus lutimaris TaxID=1737061 RepID=A0A2N5X1C8_9GAMM|nr:flagellar motor switch protein FliG [Pseudohalioglobus lutimaris]PLW68296.1 flagellar motor switch protein FliG [Pseudohalioglobus lutimaris]